MQLTVEQTAQHRISYFFSSGIVFSASFYITFHFSIGALHLLLRKSSSERFRCGRRTSEGETMKGTIYRVLTIVMLLLRCSALHADSYDQVRA